MKEKSPNESNISTDFEIVVFRLEDGLSNFFDYIEKRHHLSLGGTKISRLLLKIQVMKYDHN
jgi:hypothetical protein